MTKFSLSAFFVIVPFKVEYKIKVEIDFEVGGTFFSLELEKNLQQV